jgi:hypothetical protein
VFTAASRSHSYMAHSTYISPPKLVKYQMRGTPEGYRRKVYGDDWDGTVSPEDLLEEHYAWDLRAGYDWLWREYNDEICHMEIHKGLHEVTTPWTGGQHDLVISTVPRKIWAMPRDQFLSTKVWALGDAVDTQRVYLYRADEFTVICDGTIDNDWYRVSNIFGYCTMEWPSERSPFGDTFTDLPPARGASIVEKPLSHNSTAASDFVHLGRYGAWEKGVLTSDVFYQAMQVYAKDSINGYI